jgi:hypothetical protein
MRAVGEVGRCCAVHTEVMRPVTASCERGMARGSGGLGNLGVIREFGGRMGGLTQSSCLHRRDIMRAVGEVGRCCTVHTEVMRPITASCERGMARGSGGLGNLGVIREFGIRVRQRHGTLVCVKARVWTIKGPWLLRIQR